MEWKLDLPAQLTLVVVVVVVAAAVMVEDWRGFGALSSPVLILSHMSSHLYSLPTLHL